MEKVSPKELNISLISTNLNSTRIGEKDAKYKEAKIEQGLGSRRFLAAFDDGGKIIVIGSRELKVGDRVKVFLSAPFVKEAEELKGTEATSLGLESGIQWSVFIPLNFGGGGSNARLEVFVEKQSKGMLKKNSPIYFIFSTKTERQGDIQWSIYLKGRQVTIQVYAPFTLDIKKKLNSLVQDVEKALKKTGFILIGQTIFLSRAFKVPDGFRLNVRG